MRGSEEGAVSVSVSVFKVVLGISQRLTTAERDVFGILEVVVSMDFISAIFSATGNGIPLIPPRTKSEPLWQSDCSDRLAVSMRWFSCHLVLSGGVRCLPLRFKTKFCLSHETRLEAALRVKPVDQRPKDLCDFCVHFEGESSKGGWTSVGVAKTFLKKVFMAFPRHNSPHSISFFTAMPVTKIKKEPP